MVVRGRGAQGLSDRNLTHALLIERWRSIRQGLEDVRSASVPRGVDGPMAGKDPIEALALPA